MKKIVIAGGGKLAGAIALRLREDGATVVQLADPDGWANPAELADASALVLAADSDSGNVDLALQTRRKHPALPLVVRVFDSGLASYLTETIPGVTILSMSQVAAPVFAEAARKVLSAPPPQKNPRRPRPKVRRRTRVDRVLVGALVSLFLLVFPSALIFSQALNLRYMDALYFVWTTVMTVGYGDIALKDAPDSIKIFGMTLMLAGAGFIAVLFALLNDFVLSRRLDVLRGRTRVRGMGHALIVGAGNLGFRVAELLAPTVHHLVILERNPENRNIAALRLAGRHAIIADATNEEMLDLAGLDTAGVVLAVTDSDSVNLQIALHARERGIPVIMRIVSPDLSAHVSERGEWVAFSPVLAAGEVFAQAAQAATKP